MRLYTIGFTRKSAQEFFTTLTDAGVRRVVDVRLNNVSQLAGFTRRDDLRYFLNALAGIDYVHMIDLAPASQMLKDYRAGSMSWDDYAKRYVDLLDTRRVRESAVTDLRDGDCLLCSEPEPHQCHRRLAVEYVQRWRPEIMVVHLPIGS